MVYGLVFDDVIVKQLQKVGKNKAVRAILQKMLDDLEENGPRVTHRIDVKQEIYEAKCKRPPLRLYYQVDEEKKEIYVFEYEMKTSELKQKHTLGRIKHKARN